MHKIPLFVFIVVFFSFSQIDFSNISSISPDIQKKILSNTKELENIDLNTISPIKKKELSTFSDSTDTNATIDTAISNKEIEKEKLCFYERLFKGDTIYPDSQLSLLTIFGMDLFSSLTNTSFSPVNDISIPANYVINIDDEINILLWGRINEHYTLKVSREGSINIPRLGPVSVAGLTFDAMNKNIQTRISQIEGVNVTVSLGTLRTIGIFIIGEVKTPGYYTVGSLSNITNALYLAGGITKNGSFRNIELKRNGKSVATIDLYDFLLHGSDNTGLRLLSGDVIHVPFVSKVVAVTGNIRRPAIYELKNKENLSDVIDFAGGFAPSAWRNKIQIQRYIDSTQINVLDFDSIKIPLGKIDVHDGDIIKVFPILYKNFNSVCLQGNVLRPGVYEFKNEMRITDLIHDYQQLLSETNLDYALIIRKDPPQFQSRMVPFSLKEAFDFPESDKNVQLQPRDSIIIYNKDFFEPERSVEIFGSITSPGKMKLMHNMTLRDLILQAGGLSEEASSTRGELYRRTILPNDQVVTEKIDFCVDCVMKNEENQNIVLLKSDKVFIRSKLGWEKEAKVKLSGQFNFPGVYILFEGETLGELIKRAGGFTKNAYLSAAVFNRLSVKEKEKNFFEEYNKQTEKEIFSLSNEIASKVDPQEAKALLDQQTQLKSSLSQDYKFGRIVINLEDENSYKNFALENGDEIYIPRNLYTISVLGEIYNPSTFQYNDSSLNVNAYIEAAGGLKTNADIKHIYVIKANGSIMTNNERKILNERLLPGDAIVVPQKLRYSNPHKIFIDTIDAIFKVTTVIATIFSLLR